MAIHWDNRSAWSPSRICVQLSRQEERDLRHAGKAVSGLQDLVAKEFGGLVLSDEKIEIKLIGNNTVASPAAA